MFDELSKKFFDQKIFNWLLIKLGDPHMKKGNENMIDWDRIIDLQREIGADDFDDLVEAFLEEVESELFDLKAGCDQAQLESKLHMLKGSALNFGFRAFAGLCQTGETDAAHGRCSQINIPETLATYTESKLEFLSGLRQRAL